MKTIMSNPIYKAVILYVVMCLTVGMAVSVAKQDTNNIITQTTYMDIHKD